MISKLVQLSDERAKEVTVVIHVFRLNNQFIPGIKFVVYLS